MLRDITSGKDKDIEAALDVLVRLRADVILLTSFDYDLDELALTALRERLTDHGMAYDYQLTSAPNSGVPTGLDLDGDGRLGGPRDAQGYGQFIGQGGMAILSRHHLELERDLTSVLWAELDGTRMLPDDPGRSIQRLSSTGHWIVSVHTKRGDFQLLCFAATPPVFDGPEDRNGRRNHDELAIWRHVLAGHFGEFPNQPILIGNANLDPSRGDGMRDAMAHFLSDPFWHDPLPDSATAHWDSTGPMRVSYVLPSRGFRIMDAGVLAKEDVDHVHLPVWVDIGLK